MRYKLLGRSGLRVSELCLGGMSLGGDEADESEAVIAAFGEAGGNFIDLANRYNDGHSEERVGRAVAADRARWVLATKYSLSMRADDPNAAGNSRKSMMGALEGSLRRLGTDYVDLFWVHAWDFTTAPDEVMRGLDDLVRDGKVLHVGISDAPAWVVAEANTIAILRGWTPFVGLQVRYSLLDRAAERDLLPMARHFGLAVAAWAPLGSGALTGRHTRSDEPSGGAGSQPGGNDPTERIARELNAVADEMGASPAQVAAAWVRQRGRNIIPIVGTGRLASLRNLLDGLELRIEGDHLHRLEDVSRIALGFPHDFLAMPAVRQGLYGPLEHQIDLPPDARLAGAESMHVDKNS